MRYLLIALLLSGCSFIAPINHDPALLSRLVEVKYSVDSLKCGEEEGWASAETKVKKLEIYATWREDPQAPSIKALGESLKKAETSKNKLFCESLLKINKSRIDVIADAWKGRK